ncbi:T9SS type A sorting domain-containing protein [Flavobacterium sp. CYK-55]|uniref:T9SS type A sorting domain-containing protein n=1 Tax=Flavobacterium sp. CYK-55 TaxID=2835529 RepID=UPI001BCF3975|nr:T9SS type A sorting domain-containing protein [Flavobacterium sp. CYK-55]MBS7786098.1 T9SS type A sorting domain-containing protein [Flavobacterium sp. CYK-55]
MNIHHVNISQTDDFTLQVNLFTEAEELYYFQTWQYAVSNSEIILQVLFVPGFGSKIALLNNQFELNFNQSLNDSSKFTVKVYYQVFDENQLQDSASSVLYFPLLSSITLNNSEFLPESFSLSDSIRSIGKITIFDMSRKIILSDLKANVYNTLSNLPSGFYLILFENKKTTFVRKIIVKDRL